MESPDLHTENIYIKFGNFCTPKSGCYDYQPRFMNLLPLSSFILESIPKIPLIWPLGEILLVAIAYLR